MAEHPPDAEAASIEVEVAYALADRQRVVPLTLAPGTTARAAALASALDAEFDVDLATVPLGVFGTRVDDDHVLRSGDRVELYRPLLIDPREARRQRAAGQR